MGAGHAKAVYATWGTTLDGPSLRLLAYVALLMPDRDPYPRCELSRDVLAFGLGFTTLDDQAARKLRRVLAELIRVGALEQVQKPGPGRRAHYIVYPMSPMEQRSRVTPDLSTVDSGTEVTGDRQQRSLVTPVVDETLSSSYQDYKTGHGTNGEYDGKPRARQRRAERPLRLVPPPTAANGNQTPSIAAQAAVSRAWAHIERSDVDVDNDAGMRNDGRRDTDELAY